MTITVVGNDIRDINHQLGRNGPEFDMLVRFRRGDDYGRKQVKGGILIVAGREVPTEHLTTEALIESIASVLRERDEWIEKTDGGQKAVME